MARCRVAWGLITREELVDCHNGGKTPPAAGGCPPAGIIIVESYHRRWARVRMVEAGVYKVEKLGSWLLCVRALGGRNG